MSESTLRRTNPLYHRGEYSDEKGRDYFFDNAKFLLIAMVVIAHFIEPMMQSVPAAKYLWRVINTLHMPCMIFISGYFSKRAVKNGVLNIQRVFSYTVLFLAAQAAIFLFSAAIDADKVPSILQPQTGLWYLQCLIIWSLILPLVDRIKPKYMLPAAIIAGLLIGYDYRAGHVASLCRAFSHFPFFLAGYYISKETVQKLFSPRMRILSGAAFLGVCGIFFFLQPYGIGQLPGSKTNYFDISFLRFVPPYLWWGARLFSYVCSVLLIAGFLAFVPRCRCFFTRLGSRTLQVYILHLFIHLANMEFGWWKHLDSLHGMFIMIGIAVAAAFILSLKIFSYPFTWLQSIKLTAIIKDE